MYHDPSNWWYKVRCCIDICLLLLVHLAPLLSNVTSLICTFFHTSCRFSPFPSFVYSALGFFHQSPLRTSQFHSGPASFENGVVYRLSMVMCSTFLSRKPLTINIYMVYLTCIWTKKIQSWFKHNCKFNSWTIILHKYVNYTQNYCFLLHYLRHDIEHDV